MKELYSIRFAHVRTDKDIFSTTYTIDVPCFFRGREPITPKKITLKDKHITVQFSDNTSHVLWYTEDVELFYREKEKPKTDGKISDTAKRRRIRKSTDTK